MYSKISRYIAEIYITFVKIQKHIYCLNTFEIFQIILDFQSCCKIRTDFCIPFTHASYVNILHNHRLSKLRNEFCITPLNKVDNVLGLVFPLTSFALSGSSPEFYISCSSGILLQSMTVSQSFIFDLDPFEDYWSVIL